VALCSAHHRLHHRGLLGISGNADDPDGLEFTDHAGRRLTGCGRPAPPPAPVVLAGAGTDTDTDEEDLAHTG